MIVTGLLPNGAGRPCVGDCVRVTGPQPDIAVALLLKSGIGAVQFAPTLIIISGCGELVNCGGSCSIIIDTCILVVFPLPTAPTLPSSKPPARLPAIN